MTDTPTAALDELTYSDWVNKIVIYGLVSFKYLISLFNVNKSEFVVNPDVNINPNLFLTDGI